MHAGLTRAGRASRLVTIRSATGCSVDDHPTRSVLGPGSNPSLPALCHVSRHPGSLCRVIPEECSRRTESLAVPGRVDCELAQELAVLGDDADVGAGDEDSDWPMLV